MDPRATAAAPRDVTDTSASVRADMDKVAGLAISLAGKFSKMAEKFGEHPRFKLLGKAGQNMMALAGGMRAATNLSGEQALKAAIKLLDRFKAEIAETAKEVKAASKAGVQSPLGRRLASSSLGRLSPHAGMITNAASTAGDLGTFDAAMMRGDGKRAALALAAAAAHGVATLGSGAAVAGISVAAGSGGIAAAPAAPVAGIGEAANIGFGILGDILAYCAED